MSLRRRLAIGLVVISAVLIVTNVVLTTTIRSVLLDRVDRQLAEVASDAGPRFGPGLGPSFAPLPESDRAVSEYFIAVGRLDSAEYLQVSSSLGADEAQSTPRLEQREVLQHVTDDRAVAQPFTAPSNAGSADWRVVAQFNFRDGLVTIVASSLGELENTVADTRRVQLLGTLTVLVALGLVSWWMLRLGIQPLEQMAATADAIATGDLSKRVEHPGAETETGRLGVALNSMLGRIESSFRDREESEDRVRRFAADASHELRTPLTAIRGYAELWRAGGLRSDEELAEAMRRVEEEAGRMGNMVEDLLTLARLDQRRPLDQAAVRLDVLAADAARDARAAEPGRRIELRAEEVTVEGDEARLRQVFGNLLANVRAHTPLDAAASITIRGEGKSALVEVADSGPGMPADVAGRVFERFFRADPARSRKSGGTGLGLSIVAAIVEAHGGTVTVSSEAGRGSTFAVQLPRAAPPTSSPNSPDS